MSYFADGRIDDETFGSGLFSGTVLDRRQDALLRPAGIDAQSGGATLLSQSLGYDAGASRLQSVASGDAQVTYTYHPQSNLVNTVTHSVGGVVSMTTSKTWDNHARLSAISHTKPGAGGTVSAFGYTIDGLDLRTRVDLSDGTYWTYGYDALGQVTSGKRRWADGSAVAGQDFSYGFDTAGNRVQTTANGRAAVWTPNALNQYASREVPGAVDVIGTVDAAATVTVNGAAPTRQQAGYYHREIAAANASDPVYLPIVVEAEKEGQTSTVAGAAFVPETPEQFTHDADGNLTSDGRWTFTWDGENRLVGMETSAAAVAAGTPKKRLGQKTLFPAYDGNGNIVALADETGTAVAERTYDPFGRLIAETGNFSKVVPLGFSTKYHDLETELSYYGHRYYNPETGRWLSRDPIGEQGGINLYGFVANDGICDVDAFGLTSRNPNPGTFDVVFAKEEASNSSVTLRYRAKCPCKNLRLIQIVNAYDGRTAEEPWDIDYTANPAGNVPHPYYPYQNSAPNFVNLTDEPGFFFRILWTTIVPPNWSRMVAYQFFETCAVCTDDWSIRGCRRWGHTFTLGTRRSFGKGEDLPVESPSAYFQQLLSGYGFSEKLDK